MVAKVFSLSSAPLGPYFKAVLQERLNHGLGAQKPGNVGALFLFEDSRVHLLQQPLSVWRRFAERQRQQAHLADFVEALESDLEVHHMRFICSRRLLKMTFEPQQRRLW